MSQELALATRRDALRQGVIAAIAAYGIWGLVPLFFRQLAHVPADEIIAQSSLTAFVASGPGADRLAARLRDAPGVTAAAAFGATLHVCGPEREALISAIEPYRADAALEWQEAAPTLEDIFIHLMSRARDNALDS